jgi:dephospho-CoA kinase
MFIGIAGTLGAGKGTVVEYLKEKGFVHYSASGALREILRAEGLEEVRENMTILADKLRTENPASPQHIIFEKFQIEKPEKAILEAIHSVGEVEYLKERGAIILGVDADLETRYKRIINRGTSKDNVTFGEFKKIAIHEEEGGGKHNIRAVLEMADYTIKNNGTLEELHAQVEEILKKIESKK